MLDQQNNGRTRDECARCWENGVRVNTKELVFVLFLFLGDELVALAVDVDDFDLFVHAQVLTQLGDVDVHGAGVEVVVVDPDLFECEIALEDFVHVRAEQAEEFAFLGGELLRCFAVLHFRFKFRADALSVGFVAAGVAENLLLRVEGVVLTDVVERAFAVFLALYATENGVDAEGELFHGEGLGEVVVSTYAEAFEYIFFERFGGEEDDGHFGVGQADLFGQGEAVLLGHHHVEDTEIVFAAEKFAVALFAVVAEHGVVAFGQKIFAEEHAEVLVVLAEEDSNFSVKSHSGRYL